MCMILCRRCIFLNVIYCLLAATVADINKLQQQIQHLMDLIQKLTVEFRAVKTEVEESRVDVNNICEILNDILNT